MVNRINSYFSFLVASNYTFLLFTFRFSWDLNEANPFSTGTCNSFKNKHLIFDFFFYSIRHCHYSRRIIVDTSNISGWEGGKIYVQNVNGFPHVSLNCRSRAHPIRCMKLNEGLKNNIDRLWILSIMTKSLNNKWNEESDEISERHSSAWTAHDAHIDWPHKRTQFPVVPKIWAHTSQAQR